MELNCDPASQGRINSFALVVYLPEPLGSFVDGLRRELVPACAAQSHVTLLPPRPLSISAHEAWQEVGRHLAPAAPFEIELGEIGIFENTSVVYIEILRGREEMIRLHQELNQDGLGFLEPYSYHPHVTLAQDFDRSLVPKVEQLARRRWSEFAQSRTFLTRQFTFVQNTSCCGWLDLAECPLGGAPIPLEGALTQKG